MDVTPELISRYADGALSPAEAEAVEAALVEDEGLQGELRDLTTLAELFGHVEPEEISEAARERLYALRPVEQLESFEKIEAPAVRRRRWAAWQNWTLAAAALVLCAIGIRQLTHKPELPLHNFTRITLSDAGEATDTRSRDLVTMRAGDTLKTGPNEKIAFQTQDGSEIVLMPGSELELGDPRDLELATIERGTVLCTVPDHEQIWSVRAADYVIHTGHADFGVRVEGLAARASGLGGGRARVAVAVSRGRVEIGDNGNRETVDEYEAIVLHRGDPVRRTHASADPIYGELMRSFRQLSEEIAPGYFTGERGVRVIASHRWRGGDGRLQLTVTDSEESAGASYLVFHVRASRETALLVTRLVPYRDAPGVAEATTVRTAPIGTEWTLVAVPLSAFGASDAKHVDRKISRSRSSLARLELRAEKPDAVIRLKTSLWAERPPVGAGR